MSNLMRVKHVQSVLVDFDDRWIFLGYKKTLKTQSKEDENKIEEFFDKRMIFLNCGKGEVSEGLKSLQLLYNVAY